MSLKRIEHQTRLWSFVMRWVLIVVSFVLINTTLLFAQTPSKWEHNGSVFTLVASGSARKFYYEMPRPTMAAQGVKPGTLVFEGRRVGNQYVGKAYVFSEKCGTAAYDVQGDVSSDEREVTLQGNAPLRDSDCQIAKTREDILIFRLLPSQGAATSVALLCKFETALVPCEKLAVPVSPGFSDTELKYRFLKYVPLWPNQAIFGGLAEPRPPEFNFNGNNNEAYLKGQVEFHNRIEKMDVGKQTIEVQPISTNLSGPTFVDHSLANAKAGVGFQGPRWQPFESRLINTAANVYRGSEVFDEWKKSLAIGSICSKSMENSSDGESNHACAFTRSKQINQNEAEIEYCSYTEGDKSKVRSNIACITVAKETGTNRSVLSVLYTIHDVGGGGGELEFKCLLPERSAEDTSQAISEFLQSYLGSSSRLSAQPLLKSFKAEALNVENKDERMFMRVFLRGSLDRLGDEPFGNLTAAQQKRLVSSPLLTVVTFFTVSAQSSDSVINYREPNPAMGNRISNSFMDQFRKAMKKFTPAAVCGASLL